MSLRPRVEAVGLGRLGTGWSPFLEAHRSDWPTRAVKAWLADANAGFAREHGIDARGVLSAESVPNGCERSRTASQEDLGVADVDRVVRPPGS